jgi:hypothetical protein
VTGDHRPAPRRRMSREERAEVYWRSAFFASVLAMGAVTYGTAYKLNQASDRKWCQVVSTYNNAVAQTPPTTGPGKNLAAAMAQLSRDLGCP